MATMNISLPDPMKDWVQAQVDSGKYANASDFIRDLIRRHQLESDKVAALIQALKEGDESGVSDRSVTEIITEAKQELMDEQIQTVQRGRSGL